MANDKQFNIAGTGSLVAQEFGFWADYQSIRVTGATAYLSWNGTDLLSIGAGQGIEYDNHRRCKLWVSGTGATITVIVSSNSEV